MTKVEFVQSLPSDTPATQVVAKAKERGMKLSTQYVYVIRSKAGKGKAGQRAPQRRASGSQAERSFATLVLELGFARSSELFEQLRRSAQEVARA